MTKAPQPGHVKTRLVPPLTPEEAAQLNVCFLRDLAMSILRACEMSPARGIAAYTPQGNESMYKNILPEAFVLIPQRGKDFGERLLFAAADLFACGFSSVCLINSDSPTVPPSSFAEDAIELANPGDRIVLGPSDDGGYYLIGLKQLHSHVFDQIDWSTAQVSLQTRERANELDLTVHELASGYDIDDRATLQRLCSELLDENASDNVAPNTREFLKSIVAKL